MALALEIFQGIVGRGTVQGKLAAERHQVELHLPAQPLPVSDIEIRVNLMVNVLDVVQCREGHRFQLL